MSNVKNFTMIDEGFTCKVCGSGVKPLGYTARDHCPICLSSLHVDINPGDRLENCHGILKPIDVIKGKKDSLKIIYKCEKCGMEKKNITATDDDFNKILKLMSKV